MSVARIDRDASGPPDASTKIRRRCERRVSSPERSRSDGRNLDANRHLRNTAYLDYATHVRFAYLAVNGFAPERFAEANIGPVILREEMRFFSEVSAGDALTVDYRMSAMSPDGKRFQLHQRIWRRDGQIAAEITTDGGWLDLEHRKLVPPPRDLLEALRSVVRTESFREL